MGGGGGLGEVSGPARLGRHPRLGRGGCQAARRPEAQEPRAARTSWAASLRLELDVDVDSSAYRAATRLTLEEGGPGRGLGTVGVRVLGWRVG